MTQLKKKLVSSVGGYICQRLFVVVVVVVVGGGGFVCVLLLLFWGGIGGAGGGGSWSNRASVFVVPTAPTAHSKSGLVIRLAFPTWQ